MTDTEKILDILASMQLRMATKDDLDAVKQDLENQILKINIKIETDIEPRLDALAEGQSAILEQLVPCSRVDELENEVKFLKRIVYQITDDMEKLKKAQ